MAQRQDTSPDMSSSPSLKASKRRQECLQNQRRYRLRKKKKMEAKTQHLATLRVEINRLEERMHMLKAKLLMRFIEAGMQRSNVLAAYWHLFRFGMAEPTGRHHAQQIEFVQTHMCADMYVNGDPGCNKLLDQWKLCQQLLPGLDAPNMQIQVFGAEQDYIVTSGIVYVHFSREAIAMIYPRLLAREDLVQLILERPAALPLRVSCHFNSKNQVQSMELDLNILEGLRQSLAKHVNVYQFYEALEDAASEAHVTTHGLWDDQMIKQIQHE